MSARRLRRIVSVVAAAVVLVGVLVSGQAASGAEPDRPNVLLIVLDDATLQGVNDMLRDSRALIVGSVGIAYENSYVAIPSCCPERGTLMTGQFPHNSGVTQQLRGALLDKTTTVPADLRRAGYRTYHVGKLLHENIAVDPAAGVFDQYLIGLDGYTNPYWNLNGTVRQIQGYTTTIAGNYTRRFLTDAENRNDAQPWYLSLNFKAPHAPSTPEARYSSLAVPPLAAFPDEVDRSDKPSYVRNQNVTRAQAAPARTAHWRTMASVDDQVVATLNWLANHGELQNTLVILTSDNGYHFGQNRRHSKFIPYTPAIQVPLWLRGPGVTPGGTNRNRMVSGVDVATTIFAATGAVPSRVPDGESLLGPPGRTEVYAEYFNDERNGPLIPSWATVRSATWQYIETYDIATGALAFREYYDLAADPHMLRNLLADGNPSNDPPTAAIATRLTGYRTCSGAATCP